MTVVFGVLAVVVSTLSSCGGGVDDGPVVLVIQDGSEPDALEVVTPAVLGLELALEGTEIGTRIVDVADLNAREQADDTSVVAAVIAPFTLVSPEALRELVDDGVPVMSVSALTAQGPSTNGAFRALVPPVEVEAGTVAQLAECAAGDGSTWSAAFLEELPTAMRLEGGPVEVADAAAEARCEGLAWAGGAGDGARLAELLARTTPATTYVITSHARTAAFAEAVDRPLEPAAACACVDLTTSSAAAAQRFVHGYQVRHGLEPGPFAVEGYDVGRALVDAIDARVSRGDIASTLSAMRELEGLVSTYAWDEAGGLREPPVRMYERVGLRWLEGVPTRVAGGGTQA